VAAAEQTAAQEDDPYSRMGIFLVAGGEIIVRSRSCTRLLAMLACFTSCAAKAYLQPCGSAMEVAGNKQLTPQPEMQLSNVDAGRPA
jgi:hypothetical protein